MKQKFMRRAIKLARRGWGTTSPNPMVGAVVVDDGQIVGQGYHRRRGGPHAEVLALQEAGGRAAGADLYVNLEPCNHHGATPPCTEEIINRGIKRVFAAVRDPNPLVGGQGFSRLRGAGVEVHRGVCSEEATRLNETYVKFIRTERPFVLLKMAMTLDGKIATRTGDSRWISGQQARRWVHHMRAGYDAVMVGVETALADDPRLNCRLPDVKLPQQPLRIVADSRGRLPPDARMIRDTCGGRVILAATSRAPENRLRRLRSMGVQVHTVPESNGSVDAAGLFRWLGQRQVTSVLVEGGGELAWSLLSASLVDKVAIFVAGKIVGGRDAPTPVRGGGVRKMSEALQVDELKMRRCADDLLLTGYISTEEGEPCLPE